MPIIMVKNTLISLVSSKIITAQVQKLSMATMALSTFPLGHTASKDLKMILFRQRAEWDIPRLKTWPLTPIMA